MEDNNEFIDLDEHLREWREQESRETHWVADVRALAEAMRRVGAKGLNSDWKLYREGSRRRELMTLWMYESLWEEMQYRDWPEPIASWMEILQVWFSRYDAEDEHGLFATALTEAMSGETGAIDE